MLYHDLHHDHIYVSVSAIFGLDQIVPSGIMLVRVPDLLHKLFGRWIGMLTK